MSRPVIDVPLLALLVCLVGCASARQTPEERAAAAKALFDQTTKECHLPSAEAKEPEKSRLLNAAAAGYEKLLKQYRDQTHWCAQALRSLGNVRAAQGRLDDAVKIYSRVATRYPGQEWEVLQSWKSAADLLWEANRRAEARDYYQEIVKQFDLPSAPAIVKTIVRAAKSRLAATD